MSTRKSIFFTKKLKKIQRCPCFAAISEAAKKKKRLPSRDALRKTAADQGAAVQIKGHRIRLFPAKKIIIKRTVTAKNSIPKVITIFIFPP